MLLTYTVYTASLIVFSKKFLLSSISMCLTVCVCVCVCVWLCVCVCREPVLPSHHFSDIFNSFNSCPSLKWEIQILPSPPLSGIFLPHTFDVVFCGRMKLNATACLPSWSTETAIHWLSKKSALLWIVWVIFPDSKSINVWSVGL